ncbi:MAG: CidA/LrgA family protein [Clostridia bacterium]|nr:CidA/LrgA family protein [Clostridia bacterium]
MKYIRQLVIILGVSFAGEALNFLLPLPVPSSIYGLSLMLLLLCTKVLKVDHIKETGDFLLQVMPIMFVPAGTGIVKHWGTIKPVLIPCIFIIIPVTVIVMAVTGIITQKMINAERKENHKNA